MMAHMKVDPFKVKKSAPDASEQVFHFTRVKSIQSKFAIVLSPEPIIASPEVAVRYAWSSVA
jgi:hypothetical protein